ncbi:MAG TPA: MBL fold metallo-hydrolase, partial [Gammaproteobacteria bacterium]
MNAGIKLFALLGLLLGSATLQADNYPPSTVEMELVQVSERASYVPGAPGTAIENEGFISNAGVVVTEAGVVV